MQNVASIEGTAGDLLAVINCAGATLSWVRHNAMDEVYADYLTHVGKDARVTKEQLRELLEKMDEILEHFHGQIISSLAVEVLGDILGDFQNGK